MGVLSRAFALGVVALVLLTLGADHVRAEAQEQIDVAFLSDPLFDEVNDPINILEADVADTVIQQWQDDLGDAMPNGTFYGPLFRTSEFEHNGEAAWFPTSDDKSEGQFTYLIFSAHFNLTPQQVMSGASEFWLRLPFAPDAVEADFGLTLAVFEGEDNSSLVTLPTTYEAPTSGRYQEIMAARPTIDGRIPDMMVQHSWWNMADNEAPTPGTSILGYDPYYEAHAAGGRLYLKCDMLLRPGTDYVISAAFRWMPQVPLRTFWATAEYPTGNTSVLNTCLVDIEGDVFTLLANRSMSLGLDMDWSFVFTQGVGQGGLFGKTINVERGSHIQLFPYTNVSLAGTQYPSFVLPFIGVDPVEVHPQIYNAHGITLASGGGWHTWEFNAAGGEGADLCTYYAPEVYVSELVATDAPEGQDWVELADVQNLREGIRIYFDDDDSPVEWHTITGIEFSDKVVYLDGGLERPMETAENGYAWAYVPVYWEYRDFVVFSSNRTLDWTEFEMESMWNVMVDLWFNDTAELTLLCYEDSRPPADWDDLEDGHYNTSLYPYARPHLFNPDGTGSVMGYEVWMSARGTSGQWSQVSTGSDGNVVRTHYFPQIIQISRAEWRLANDSAAVNEVLGLVGEAILDYMPGMGDAIDAWSAGDYLGAIRLALKATIMGLWKGLGDVWGIIYDRLSDIWQSLRKFGHWVKTALFEFFGKIWNAITEAWDTIASFWQSIKYVMAPAVMLLVIGLVSAGLQYVNPRRSGA